MKLFQSDENAGASWTHLFTVAISLAASSLFAQDSSSTDPVLQQNPLVKEAFTFFENGDSDAALENFQDALNENGEDLSALLGQAMVYAELERHADAFVAYDAIVQNYPRHAFAWNGRGLAAFNLEDFDEALYSFEQSTAEQPINGFFYESLAWTQMCRGEFEDAANSAKRATLMYSKRNESSAYPLLIAYFAYTEIGDLSNAQSTLRYAYKNKPINSWPAPIIDYLAGTMDASELVSHVKDSKQETEAHTYIGLNLRSNGEIAEGMKHLEWVTHRGNPRVLEYTLARALNLQNSVAVFIPNR